MTRWTTTSLTFFLAFAFISACADDGTKAADDPNHTVDPPAAAGYAEGAMPAEGPFSETIEGALTVEATAETYTLPVALDEVENLAALTAPGSGLGLTLDEGARAALAANGSVLITGGEHEHFFAAYQQIGYAFWEEPPVFVTTDSVLHLYHLFFDQLLKYVEVEEFVTLLEALMPAMADASLAQAALFEGELAEAARRNAAFFSVAAALLDEGFAVPAAVSDEVEAELELIKAHQELAASPLFNQDCPEDVDPCDPQDYRLATEAGHTCYCEDYTQYVPRGHYTLTPDLERYFRAMMWAGRVAFRIKSDTETRMAVLATDALKRVKLTIADQELAGAEAWSRIYRVTEFFVGAADDLTFIDYDQAIAAAFPEGFDLNDLADAATLAALQAKLRELRAPQILSGFISAFQDVTEDTQGWRFMGQRFAPDSYVLGQMVWNHIGPDLEDPAYADAVTMCFEVAGAEPSCEGMTLEISNCICYALLDTGAYGACRLLPRGLDVMSVLGDPTAEEVLLEMDGRYCGLDERLGELQEEFTAYAPQDWVQNAYWGWLHALKPLFGPFDEGYPVWMRTRAWGLKGLNAALASWAELRHDTILYVKQSYTPGVEGSAELTFAGYVEPQPRFYHRLAFLTRFTRDGLSQLDCLPAGLDLQMGNMAGLLDDLRDISLAELAGEELTDGQKDTVRYFGDLLEGVIAGLASAVTVETEPPEECGEWCMEEVDLIGDAFKSTIVADVHTDGNTKQVLEEGSGKLDWVLVINRAANGALVAAVGPIFSYYEFPHPMSDRLTDEAWRDMLATDPPARPAWIGEAFGM
jgi:hypothetical protein